MSAIELTSEELDQLYNAVDYGIGALDDTLHDLTNRQFYSAEEWAEKHMDRSRWACLLRKLGATNASEEVCDES